MLALSPPDTTLLVAVFCLTLAAAVYLAWRWKDHSRAPSGKAHPTKARGPRAKHARPPTAAPSPAHSDPSAPATIEQRRAWVRERVAHWWMIANKAHGAAIDDLPAVQFSARLKHALGWADSSRNLIKISDHHLMTKALTVADETVAHEVAHVFADRFYGRPCRHNRLWKKTMLAMGQRPEVTFKDTAQETVEAEA